MELMTWFLSCSQTGYLLVASGACGFISYTDVALLILQWSCTGEPPKFKASSTLSAWITAARTKDMHPQISCPLLLSAIMQGKNSVIISISQDYRVSDTCCFLFCASFAYLHRFHLHPWISFSAALKQKGVNLAPANIFSISSSDKSLITRRRCCFDLSWCSYALMHGDFVICDINKFALEQLLPAAYDVVRCYPADRDSLSLRRCRESSFTMFYWYNQLHYFYS